MLKGLNYPLTPKDKSTLNPPPPMKMYLAKVLEALIKPAYALEHAAEAHRYLESRKSTGKLVLSVGS
jgi:hypothetical protein